MVRDGWSTLESYSLEFSCSRQPQHGLAGTSPQANPTGKDSTNCLTFGGRRFSKASKTKTCFGH